MEISYVHEKVIVIRVVEKNWQEFQNPIFRNYLGYEIFQAQRFLDPSLRYLHRLTDWDFVEGIFQCFMGAHKSGFIQ